MLCNCFFRQLNYTTDKRFVPFLWVKALIFQGSTHHMVWSSRYAPYRAYPSQNPDVRLSRIRLFAKLIVHLSCIYTDIYLRQRQWIQFHHFIISIPCETPTVAPAVEPVEQCPADIHIKAANARGIVSNSQQESGSISLQAYRPAYAVFL